ncbi:MAG: DUF2258 domain-containing protein [Sulfolobales archaeon]|nr:DUF2258 domain-containing protein [Sulfolobales archaeon]MCX8185712.1 DUF2258 domain-containing protein [Sulfolobales archaeon]MDW7969655.1 DUF2258 domain-containing protein [Sulfolobales archaeon]
MGTLRSGYIIVGAYADKVRRVMFAQLRDHVREGIIKGSEVAFKVAQLNKVLYKVFVDELRLGKGDLVRISVDYELKDGVIEWLFDTLKIEVFKRMPDDEVKTVLERVKEGIKAVAEAAVVFNVERLGETEDGDLVYVMKLGDREVGAFIITPVDNELVFVKKGAALEPTPMVVEKFKIECRGVSIEDAIKENIDKFSSNAKYVSLNDAAKIIELVKKRVGIEYKVERLEEFEE